MNIAVTKDLSMHTLIHTVLSSDKFEQIVRNGEKGYYDKQEKVFVPTKFVGNLIKEIIDGPAVILGSNDPDSRYALCQVRINRALKTKFKTKPRNAYKRTIQRYISKEFLKLHANSSINFAALYIDLVGSTLMSMRLSTEHLTTIIGIFTQEMTDIVSAHNGYVLKYAGDAVIAFFPETDDFSTMCVNALNCAMEMKNLLQEGVNAAITKAGFEPLNIRIGIEAGANKIMLIAGDVDIIGFNMNIAAKVQSTVKPGGVGIGQNCYAALDKEGQSYFVPLKLDSSWKYKDSDGNPYKLYEYGDKKDEPSQKVTKEPDTKPKAKPQN